jgi:hypothetical protein
MNALAEFHNIDLDRRIQAADRMREAHRRGVLPFAEAKRTAWSGIRMTPGLANA